MKIKTLILSLFLTFGFGMTVYAEGLRQDQNLSVVNAYRSYKDIDNISINVPTIAEIPFANEFIEHPHFVVFDKKTNSFEPYYFRQEISIKEVPVLVKTNLGIMYKMTDKKIQTYDEFPLVEGEEGQAHINISSPQPVTSYMLNLLLDAYVALPTFVEIRAFVDGQDRVIVAKRRVDQEMIRFPETTSNNWTIIFNYNQPLRISELQLNQINTSRSNTRAVRFLAQPGHSYRIYFDSDRASKVITREAGNLALAHDVLVVPTILSHSNPQYTVADSDADGVPDARDNCVSVSNYDQKDVNNNNLGDACDDFDYDGLMNSKDNCPDNPNYSQDDADGDGIGDLCDKQESRITERYPFIPWVGIGFAAIVLIILFVLTARATYVQKQDNE